MTWRCALCHAADIPHRKRDICDDCEAWLEASGNAWCTRGKHRVLASEIVRSAGSTCKACKATYARTTYAPEVMAERNRRWRQANDAWLRAYRRRPDVRARQAKNRRISYWKNVEKERARKRVKRAYYTALMRAWRVRRPEYGAIKAREYYQRRKLRLLQSWRHTA